MKKKQWVQHGLALLLALATIMVLDRLTNRLDSVEGHAWDFVYYIDMAENGILHNDHLGAPYAYRPLTPMLARGINLLLGTETYFGFRITAYAGLLSTLFGIYLIARHFKLNFLSSCAVMLVPALALFNVKFLMFDFYRPDQLSYPMIVFGIYALLKGRWELALLCSVIGLQTREYPIIPALLVMWEAFRAWLADKRDWKPYFRAGITVVVVGLAVFLPRMIIPVTFTQQILDPFNDPSYLKTLLGMPFEWKRDYNFVFNLVAYFLPVLILFTPTRLKTAWREMGQYRAWVLIYVGVNLLGMMYGGTDMMRYATYFFIPQMFLMIFFLKQDVTLFEMLYLAVAGVIFNRLLFLFPIWDFGLYLDFYGGYGDHINTSSHLRWLELIGLIGLGQALRFFIHKGKPMVEKMRMDVLGV